MPANQRPEMDTTTEEEQPPSLPDVLISDIFARLPVKTLTRFKCLSTRHRAALSRPSPDFTRDHLSHSLERRRLHSPSLSLIITFADFNNSCRLLYSATVPGPPHPQAPATHLLSIPGYVSPFVSRSIQGLIALEAGPIHICNPSTRQYLTLPLTEPETPPSVISKYDSSNSFGFDPIKNEHKVLNTWFLGGDHPDNEIIMEHRVFDINGNSSGWRRIDDGPPHIPFAENVCVSGVVYYRALYTMLIESTPFLVAFDVGKEEFRFINMPGDWVNISRDSVLIELDGRVTVVHYNGFRRANSMKMWVLEDVWEERWVKRKVFFPENWREIRGDPNIYLAGSVYTGEMMFAPRRLDRPFCLFFYDVKRNSVRRVEICGLPEHESRFGDVYVSATDHVESILPLSGPGNV